MRVTDLVFSYGDRVVFDGLSLTASPGRRLGLVGENGAGKSTLLRLLAGFEEPLAGTVERGEDLGFLAQELPFPGSATLAGVLDEALAGIRAVARRLDELAERLESDPAAAGEYGRALEWAQAHDLWDADRRAALVLAGLGLGELDPGRRLDTLSGGQRSRLGLAALLIRQPGTLLLDEPTNHLDDSGLEFLERHLARLNGIVVLSSHDRVFLDAVCTDIVDLDPALGGPTRYGGAYTEYLRHKRAERARWEQRYAAEQAELKQLAQSVAVTARRVAHDRAPRDNAKMLYDFKSGRVQKQISRRVRNAQQRLDELTRSQVPRPPAPLRFAAPALTRAAGEDEPALTVHDVRVPGRLHIGHLELTGSGRLLVAGGNGAGKSTLLSVLAGRLEPADGAVHRRRGLRAGLLEQDVTLPDPGKSPRRLYAEAAGPEAVPLHSLGLLPPAALDRPAGLLSVGQRRRLALAILVALPLDVLLLDEPTNHLSLTLAEELFDALDSAPGAVVVASHDRWLRRGWNHPVLRLHRGEVVRAEDQGLGG
ncbi:ABC-F family ATP-binding cassette domain-containing protein [Amycolatopsis rhizosphaerae]|uniref:ABC-F family ATP-binding cassette domain-containing protein n=1 Tax=Amycolatopsis rhizosphaerae TaxID=2053003 RepID=A0A558CB27_9PSEU|nr:ABC-F family ATP-binding cassette domain-containing protein [Amycolatopsis rhizosphaerae]TVT45985.1 ABC-F family ATP-binding cassette domain-containing protein [Amycolatopsis rhizosphaerae]